MNQPLVSIYITNYNYEKYIRKSIESVLNQTLSDFELFIIDDGSTDNSKSIIEEYRSNPKIEIIYQQNKGLNRTNNVAMNASSGKYFMRLDADDFLESNALEVMSSVLESDLELGLVFPDYYYVDANGEITGKEQRHDFEKDVSLYDQPAHGACTMIRLQFLRDLGGYNEEFTCQDGYDLWIKFILNHKVNNINQPLFSYRRHGSNLTTNEERILTTRQKIKAHYITSHQLNVPKTLAVIPVRKTKMGQVNWPLFESNGKTVIESAIETACNAENVDWVVVTTSDEEVLNFIETKNVKHPKLFIIPRPESFARINESLNKTFDLVLDQLEYKNIRPEAMMSISIEYPFLKSDVIDDAINTLTIFKGDSLLSLRPDNRMYYQHIGHGMVPILDQDKFTKLEREALYKGAGGVVISTIKNYKRRQRMIGGKVGHIVVDQHTAFGVWSEYELNLIKNLV
ncbi:glycosyltransferase [Pedobacter metabolipauper]|uniref:Glycosyl transferase family 2 n=1 Tax=Pedobacter metabolipauper TaxID=425513 RepID=A0A4V3D1A8_9SPHI|nr:glycosyltransferase [Pedobacter metabolipauper]TDQ09927.1 glycosyl transferase family 2 [Pedobacter metabolipauper]